MKRFFLSCIAIAALIAVAFMPAVVSAASDVAAVSAPGPVDPVIPDLVTAPIVGELLAIGAVIAIAILLYVIFGRREDAGDSRADPRAPFRPGQPKPPD